jgi:precorrin-6A/cobalt-precorrin-6A reductase
MELTQRRHAVELAELELKDKERDLFEKLAALARRESAALQREERLSGAEAELARRLAELAEREAAAAKLEAELLEREAAPTRDMIADALGGVLCRCTGYAKIIAARELNIPIIMVKRPPMPEGEKVVDIEEAIAWLKNSVL